MHQACGSLSNSPHRYLHREPLSSALEALRSTSSLYTHIEDVEDATPTLIESRHPSPSHAHHITGYHNSMADLEACPTWPEHEASTTQKASTRLGRSDGFFGRRWAASEVAKGRYESHWAHTLEKRLRVGSWVAVVVLLVLTICFMMREL
ncbi:hypothetical protein BD779DRAFT_1468031 [Infundibulicybe gibba]|nr:hypothetical protein BD779DRAFT_1468031 [Infundibulicybe gibba]